jgi:hypothetical protein
MVQLLWKTVVVPHSYCEISILFHNSTSHFIPERIRAEKNHSTSLFRLFLDYF